MNQTAGKSGGERETMLRLMTSGQTGKTGKKTGIVTLMTTLTLILMMSLSLTATQMKSLTVTQMTMTRE